MTSTGAALKPSIGRIVHYQSYGTPGGEYLPEPRAAVITCTYDEPPELADPTKTHVGLCILNPTGMFFNQLVPFAESPPQAIGTGRPEHNPW
ncbi:UNVERIFIED_ORG: hypothetical protein M2328_005783 [Rhodococcus erythropolis]